MAAWARHIARRLRELITELEAHSPRAFLNAEG